VSRSGQPRPINAAVSSNPGKIVPESLPWYLRSGRDWNPPEVPVYSNVPPVAEEGILFAESSLVPGSGAGISFFLLVVMIPTGVLLGLVIFDLLLEGNGSVLGWWFNAGLWLMCFVVVVFMFGCSTLWIKRILPWPIVLRRVGDRAVVQRVGTKWWCYLDELSPTVTIGSVRFLNASRPFWKITARTETHTGDRAFGIWLLLQAGGRRGWALLDRKDSESDALEMLLAWSDVIGLDPVSDLAETPAPTLVYTKISGRRRADTVSVQTKFESE
jgi:hypothetical protein